MHSPEEVIAIGSSMHSKWSYKTVVLYRKGTLVNGKRVWKKVGILAEATTDAKIRRLAEEESRFRGIPFISDVRHNDPVKEEE